MIRGIYIAQTGMLNRSRSINIIGNNITNSDTVGYKKDDIVSGSFGEYMMYKSANGASSQIGSITNGVTEDKTYITYQQGTLQHTGRTMDLAIEGEGFFTVQTQDGQTLLTRNGQFSINEKGYLVDSSGDMVLGQNGPLYIGQTDFKVTDDGQITANGASCGSLLITCPTDLTALVKEEGTKFSYTTTAQPANGFKGSIRQGSLENSNVDMTDEMSGMMEFSRSYQSCGQIIKMMDKIMEKTVNDIARL